MGVQSTLTRQQAEQAQAQNDVPCFHCGTSCKWLRVDDAQGRPFCCHGCRLVCELLESSGLDRFYDLAPAPGVRMEKEAQAYDFLDEPAVRDSLLDFFDGSIGKVTFRAPAMHCIACVWLLENLFRLHPGVGKSQVNFPRREVTITYQADNMRLSELAALLASLGYEPELNLTQLQHRNKPTPLHRRLTIKIGVAGFVFGNVMLMNLPAYLGLNAATEPGFALFLSTMSLLLSLPVVFYAAGDYWRAAWLSIRQRSLTIDFPIALGIAALFLHSLAEILTRTGPGYLDSLTGLVFFLLCGRWFQQRSYDALSFDRDYTAYFPLSVVRKVDEREETIALTALEVGDRIVVRHRELVPADAELRSGHALIDYSFVTGESEPVERHEGERIYAGGRQVGGAIELETVKPVSQSYLTSMWEDAAFHKEGGPRLRNVTDRISKYFTLAVVLLAAGTWLGWAFIDLGTAVRAFSAVLIVACPCALALSAPFALGTAWRALGERRVFLRGADVVEAMARTNHIVFDKTGTLTRSQAHHVEFRGAPLSAEEAGWVASLARHSTHPHCLSIQQKLAPERWPDDVSSFYETAGSGIEGTISGHALLLGSRRWIEALGIEVPSDAEADMPSQVHLAIDGAHRGAFVLTSALRDELQDLARELQGGRVPLTVLSGDSDKDKTRLEAALGSAAAGLHFRQSPHDKLAFLRGLQEKGAHVMMVGDGLNDAGALQQSDVGVAITEDTSAFAPACDAILDADRFGSLPAVLHYSRRAMHVIYACFALSFLYNTIGLSFAVTGRLSPLVSAVLMPISSVTVVSVAVLGARWAARSCLGPQPGGAS